VRLFIKRLALAARRGIPASVVPGFVQMRALVSWMTPSLRRDAMEQMRFVLGHAVSDAVITDKARAYVRRMTWRAESRWHPELIDRQPVTGMTHLEALADSGEGGLVSIAHHGDDAKFPSMRTSKVQFDTLSTPDAFKPDAPAWLRQQFAVNSRGGPIHDVSGGSAMVRQLLADGRLVTVAFDVPGSTPMRVFGRDLLGAAGALRVAYAMNAPIILVTSHPNRQAAHLCARLSVAPPLLPNSFDEFDDLLEAVVRHHEAAIVAWPEAYDEPMSRWVKPTQPGPRTG